jgi:hypothetical protein
MKFKFVEAIILALLIPVCGTPAFALQWTTPPATVVLDCNGVDFTNDSTFKTDRDNTGTGYEMVTITVTDGAGNNLISTGGGSVPLGTLITIHSSGGPSPFDTPPQCNPLTLRIISDAGNGLPEQLFFEATGACSTLPSCGIAVPTLNEWGKIIFTILAGIGSVYMIMRKRPE